MKRRERIKAPLGFVVSMYFTAFDIEYDSNCNADHLTIVDSDGTTLMEKSCGSLNFGNVVIGGQKKNTLQLPNVTSTSNVVDLIFTTDDRGAKSGWSVLWTAFVPSGRWLFVHISYQQKGCFFTLIDHWSSFEPPHSQIIDTLQLLVELFYQPKYSFVF